jgi:hypothetical protein
MFGHFRTVCSRFNPLFTAQLNGTVFAVSKVGDENVRIKLILCTEKFHEDLGIDHASKWLFHQVPPILHMIAKMTFFSSP